MKEKIMDAADIVIQSLVDNGLAVLVINDLGQPCIRLTDMGVERADRLIAEQNNKDE